MKSSPLYPNRPKLLYLPDSLLRLAPYVRIPAYHQRINRKTEPSHALSDEHYRRIQYPDGFTEFYDTETDPNEFDNLAADSTHKKEIDRLKAFLAPKRCSQPEFRDRFHLSPGKAENS